MKKRTKKNKIKPWHIILIILSIVIISFSIYFSALMMTVDGRIVEGEPLLEFVCKTRPLCEPAVMSYYCNKNYDNPVWVDSLSSLDKAEVNKLKQWKGYRGCNESTVGFMGGKSIRTVGCSCGGLFG